MDFRYIKNSLRYNKKLSFELTGKQLKSILEGIEELNPSAPFKFIKSKLPFNGDLHVPLNGEDVKTIIDAIPCPLPCLKFIKNRERYNNNFEYILTGVDIKCIIETIETCAICNEVCLIVSSEGDLPSPPEGCEFALVRDLQLESFSVGLFFWSDISEKWELHASASGNYVSGQFSEVSYSTSDDWSLTLNGGSQLIGNDFVTFDPAVNTLDIVFTFRNCEYIMDQVVAPGLPLILEFTDISNEPIVDPEDAEEWNSFFSFITTFQFATVDGNSVSLYGSDQFDLPGAIFAGNTNIIGVDDQGGYITFIEGSAFFQASSLVYYYATNDLIRVGDQAFFECTSLNDLQINPIEVNASAFGGCTSLIINGAGPNFAWPRLEIAGDFCFGNVGAVIANYPSLLIVPAGLNSSCTSLEVFSAPIATDFGLIGGISNALQGTSSLNLVNVPLALLGDSGDNSIWSQTGTTITVNCAAANETSDGGNPDGDLVWLAANNTATINYI